MFIPISDSSLEECGLDVKADENIAYTVPQKISGEKNFVLLLRVKRPMKNCSIRISQSGEVKKTVKMKKALPAVMIQIPVQKDDLNERENLEVSVTC